MSISTWTIDLHIFRRAPLFYANSIELRATDVINNARFTNFAVAALRVWEFIWMRQWPWKQHQAFKPLGPSETSWNFKESEIS